MPCRAEWYTLAKELQGLISSDIQTLTATKRKRVNANELHTKPPETAVTNPFAAATRSPSVRVLHAFILWTEDFYPTVHPGRGIVRLLSNGGIIGCHISEHLLGCDRFETDGSRIPRSTALFIFYKHRRQVIFTGKSRHFRGSFVRAFRGFLSKRALVMGPRKSKGMERRSTTYLPIHLFTFVTLFIQSSLFL